MEIYRGKTLTEWKKYVEEDKHVGIRATKYILVLEELVEELQNKLHRPTVTNSVCDNIWCENGKVNVYGNDWQECPRCRDKQTVLK